MKVQKNLPHSLSFFPVSYISSLYCLRIWQTPPGKPTASDSLPSTSFSHWGLVAFWAMPNSIFPLQICEIARISAGFSGYKQWFSSFLSLLPGLVPRTGKFPEGRAILECLLTNPHSSHLSPELWSPENSPILYGLQTDGILYFIQLPLSVLGEHQSVALTTSYPFI